MMSAIAWIEPLCWRLPAFQRGFVKSDRSNHPKYPSVPDQGSTSQWDTSHTAPDVNPGCVTTRFVPMSAIVGGFQLPSGDTDEGVFAAVTFATGTKACVVML